MVVKNTAQENKVNFSKKRKYFFFIDRLQSNYMIRVTIVLPPEVEISSKDFVLVLELLISVPFLEGNVFL